MANEHYTAGSSKTGIPASEKYMLSIREASEYFSISIKSMRRLAEVNEGSFAVFMGNRYLIIRKKFEEYMDSLTMEEEGETE